MNTEPNARDIKSETKKFLEHWRKLCVVGLHGSLFDLKDHVNNIVEDQDDTVTIMWIKGGQATVKIENRVAWVQYPGNIRLPAFTVAGISFNQI